MAEDGHKHSRAVSWVAVAIILAGFIIGGVALIIATWWLFWTGVGVVVAGGILAVVIDISADVELDPLHEGEPHVSPIRNMITGGSETPAPFEVAPADGSTAKAEADTA